MTAPDEAKLKAAFPAGAFRQIGWAFLFLAISIGPSFRLGDENFLVDLLPDCIGYLLIATAANRLVPLHRGARGVRNLALLLTYLTIPMIVQYTVATSPAGPLTTWHAPLWPLMVGVSLGDLVLVWWLCGLVAALARRMGDEALAQRARTRRVVYLLLKVLVTGGSVVVLLSPQRELILGGVLTAVVVGLILLGLMMGLMWQAERLGEGRRDVPVPPAETTGAARPGGWAFRVLAGAALLLPLVLAVGAYWYYQTWQEARNSARARHSLPYPEYNPVRKAFYDHLLAGEIDAAYESTTADFQARISRERLAELAARYVAYRNQDRSRSGVGSSGGGYEYLTQYEYVRLGQGKVTQVTLTIRRDRDSILRRQPPPLKVDDFQVEDKVAPEGQWPIVARPHNPTPAVVPAAFMGAKAGEERTVAGIQLCWCPPGKFVMGSPPDEPERRPDEAQVQVTLTKGFWMAKYETTQGQWQRVIGKLPAASTAELPEGDDYPVGNVNFSEAEAFCRKLTELAHQAGDLPKDWEFRLPTEAQWEYACRAGTTTATAFGDRLSSKQANFKGKPYNGAEPGPALGMAAKIGRYPASAWGLHDMHGNTYEWCRDWYHAKLPGGVDPDLYAAKATATKNRTGDVSRVRRGGCWTDDGWPCRSAFRLRFEPERRYDHIGFRVVAVQP